jgi:rhodanese-related sulfurtransferase
MRAITREELHAKMIRGDDFALVEVLPAEAYQKHHLPGAMNVPLTDAFEENAQLALPNKEQEVVVYCSDEDDSASPAAAKRLEQLGYRHVLCYPRGKVDWMQHGLKVVLSGKNGT